MDSLSISRAWDETKARIAADGKLFTIVAAALIAFPALIVGALNPASADTQPSLWTGVLMTVMILIAIVGQLALIRLAIGPAVSVGEAIGHGARRMPIYFVAGVIITLGLLAAVIPFIAILALTGTPLEGPSAFQSPIAILFACLYIALILFVAVRMLMTSPVASEESVGPIAILRRSWQLTEGYWWRLFGFIALFVIGAVIAMTAIGAAIGIVAVLLFGEAEPMSGSAFLIALFNAVVNAAISVLLAVMLARIYLQLAGRESLDVTVPKSGT